MTWIRNLFPSRVQRMIASDDLLAAIEIISNDSNPRHRVAAARVLGRSSSRMADVVMKCTNINILLLHLCFDRAEVVAKACLDAAGEADPVFADTQIAMARTVLASAGPTELCRLLGCASATGGQRTLLSPDACSRLAAERLQWTRLRAGAEVSNASASEAAAAPAGDEDLALVGKHCAICDAAIAVDAIQCPECGSGRLVSAFTPPAQRTITLGVAQAYAGITVHCPRCNRTFSLLKDALVVTAAGVLSDFGARTVLGGPVSAPDLIAACDSATVSTKYTEQAREVETIRRSIGTRRWTCHHCGGTYEYM